jgi:hypothetical protein
VQTVSVASTVRVGNHALTPEEAAAGLTPRDPFVDADGAPTDPSSVLVVLQAPSGEARTFAYPTPGPTDTGPVEQESAGRFYVDWTPADAEDGLWRWTLAGAMAFGSSLADQDVFFVKRPIAPPPAPVAP